MGSYKFLRHSVLSQANMTIWPIKKFSQVEKYLSYIYI